MLIRAMNKVENRYESWGYFRKIGRFWLNYDALTSIVLLFGLNAYSLTAVLNLSFHPLLKRSSKIRSFST